MGIIGGPPCQGFSSVGKRIADDPRNRLYQEYCRVVEHVQPAFFVLENVKGLLTLADGAFRDAVLRRFTSLGYAVQYRVLNAADYGVPQNRHRVFFVGVKDGASFSFDALAKTDHILSTSEAISDLPALVADETITAYTQPPQTPYEAEMRQR